MAVFVRKKCILPANSFLFAVLVENVAADPNVSSCGRHVLDTSGDVSQNHFDCEKVLAL